MSYEIDADYTQVFMFPPALEDFVGVDDPVRFIRSFVDSLDLSTLGFKSRSSTDGRPGFSTSLLLKIWLFGSFERIHSSRGLERQCKRDLALMWLSGMNYPDHNTLWRFFSDNKAAVKNLFKQSVQIALKNKLIGMVYHAIDGTKISANASRFKSLTKEEMKLLSDRLNEYLESMERAVEESKGTAPDDRLPKELQDARELNRRVKENVASLQQKANGAMSSVDIDSRKMRTNRGIIEFSYNAQAVADQQSGIIVGAEVSQAETDHHLLSSMLRETHQTVGENAASSVADAGYFSGDEMAKIENQEHASSVYVNIPVEHNRSADKMSDDRYHSNNFVYNKESDTFTCPDGFALIRARDNGAYTIYNCKHFAECPNKSMCTSSQKYKAVTMHRNHESIRRHKQKIELETVQRLLKQRGALIERVFGWIKEQFGLRRFLSRGIDNAKAWWYLACTIYNLRKIVRYTRGPIIFT